MNSKGESEKVLPIDFGAFWPEIKILWTQIRGLEDEYRFIKSRWEYLRGVTLSLPDISETFKKLDIFLDYLTEIFEREFYLFKDEEENARKFSRMFNGRIMLSEDEIALEGSGFELPLKICDVSGYVEDFSFFVGSLKNALIQRTSSLEIGQLLPGEPFSIDRSIGYELHYLAADAVAMASFKSLNFRCLRDDERRGGRCLVWDRFVTFSPLKYRAGGERGGSVYPSPSVGLYHITLDEKEKYSLASLMIIPHETAHALIRDLRMEPSDPISRKFAEIFNEIVEILKSRIVERPKDELSYILTAFQKETLPYRLGEEVIVDFLAAAITGPGYIKYVADKLSSSLLILPQCLDPACTWKEYVPRIDGLIRLTSLEALLEKLEGRAGKRKNQGVHSVTSMDVSAKIEITLAKLLKDLRDLIRDGDLLEYIEEIMIESYEVGKHIGEKLAESILSVGGEPQGLRALVRKNRLELSSHRHYVERVRDIYNKIVEGQTISGADPLSILDAYYTAFVGESERPSYMATILSIVSGGKSLESEC